MFYQPNKTNMYLSTVFVSIIILHLSGCGGSDTNTEYASNQREVIDNGLESPIVEENEIVEATGETDKIELAKYKPNMDRLDTKATASQELYVDSSFNFDSYKALNVNISAKDNNNSPLAGARLAISKIDNVVFELDDPLLNAKTLITNIFTSNNGQINITLEVPDDVNNLLLEFNAVGIENEVIYSLDETNSVVHQFQ